MLKETVIIEVDLEVKDELSEQVKGTIQSRFNLYSVTSKWKILTAANASRTLPAQQTFEYVRSFLQRHDNKLHASKIQGRKARR
jgi:PIN domain nuclease of toxin-antitoxin system